MTRSVTHRRRRQQRVRQSAKNKGRRGVKRAVASTGRRRVSPAANWVDGGVKRATDSGNEKWHFAPTGTKTFLFSLCYLVDQYDPFLTSTDWDDGELCKPPTATIQSLSAFNFMMFSRFTQVQITYPKSKKELGTRNECFLTLYCTHHQYCAVGCTNFTKMLN